MAPVGLGKPLLLLAVVVLTIAATAHAGVFSSSLAHRRGTAHPEREVTSGGRDEQKLALFDLYAATGGPHWKENTHWLQGDFCLWYGIECTNGLASVMYDSPL